MKSLLFLFAATFAVGLLNAQSTKTYTPPPALSAIRDGDLKRDLFQLASDSMQGRRAGTLYELKAAAWVAAKAQQAGLKPAGEDGSYFQFFPLRRTRVADNSSIEIGGKKIELWKDAWVTPPVESRVAGDVIWFKSIADTATTNVAGKVVAIGLTAPTPLPAPGMSLWGYRYALSAIRQYTTTLKNKGAAAIILVADDVTEAALGFVGNNFKYGLYTLEGSAATVTSNNAPVVLVRQRLGTDLQQSTRIQLDLKLESYVYPSINVVAVVPGTDAKLRNEYVLFSGHHDHDGVGAPQAGDSVWNGADDNASVTVAMLAIGRAWIAKPAKRSTLFVWHGAEERGLFGSRWYAEHPTVPKENIVAVLNGDMIGRNGADSAALLGAIAPHKNSDELVQMALEANRGVTKFVIDTSWDKVTHPEGWYFRSDHLPYARAGIPAIFFTTLLHPDYHTTKDEADRIDIKKLARVTQWMYATGWSVANSMSRPRLVSGFKLER